MSLLWLMLFIVGEPMKSFCLISPKSTDQLYVVPFPSLLGNDSNGSLAYPYSSLQQALDHIKHHYYRDLTTTINLYPTYHFVNTIRLTREGPQV